MKFLILVLTMISTTVFASETEYAKEYLRSEIQNSANSIDYTYEALKLDATTYRDATITFKAEERRMESVLHACREILVAEGRPGATEFDKVCGEVVRTSIQELTTKAVEAKDEKEDSALKLMNILRKSLQQVTGHGVER